jgi:hypothetical protein
VLVGVGGWFEVPRPPTLNSRSDADVFRGYAAHVIAQVERMENLT